MGWTDLYGQSRQNLGSMIGTLGDLAMRMKELKQRKKDNWMGLLQTGMGIAGDIGGGYLKNKWQTESEKGLIGDRLGAEKELKGLEFENQKEANRLSDQQRALQDTVEAARRRTAGEQEYAQGLTENEIQHQYRMAEIAAGKDGDGGEGDKKSGYLMARDMVEDMMKAIREFDELHKFTSADFNSIQSQVTDDWNIGRKASDPRFVNITPEDIKKAVAFWKGIALGQEQPLTTDTPEAEKTGRDMPPDFYEAKIFPAMQNLVKLTGKYKTLPKELIGAETILKQWQSMPMTTLWKTLQNIQTLTRQNDPVMGALGETIIGKQDLPFYQPPVPVEQYSRPSRKPVGPPTGTSRWGKKP